MLICALFAALGAAGVIEFRSLILTLSSLALSLYAAVKLRRWGFSAPPALLFCAIGSYVVIQLLSTGALTWFSDVGGPLHLFGLCWLLALYLLVYGLTGSLMASAVSGGALCLVFGIVDYTVRLFRGRPVLAIDVTSISTALSVSGSYEFSVTPVFCAACALALLSPLLLRSLLGGAPAPRKLFRVILRVLSGLLACLYVYMCLCTSMVGGSGIHINWDENEFEDSAVMYFIITAQKLNVTPPEGYSDEAITGILSGVDNPPPPAEGEKPNIIVVMNEAFSDLSVIGELETNKPVTPFVSSLRENAVTGYACSSVFGGNTANSEYEFLTGDTMAFVPTGSVPYQLYVNYKTDTLVSVLKAQGYTATAMHPYLASGWNRPGVYEFFGFDNVYFKDDYQSRSFLRNYVTDRCDYDNLIRWFEAKEPEERVFFFNITMQNHGSYKFEDFDAEITVSGHEGRFPLAEQYLTLANISDGEIQRLVEYFSGVEEPVILLFFGDHQPSLEKEFYDLLYGHDSAALTVEEQERKQYTPFFIWANYPIEERDAGPLSMNYLASLLLDTAGLEKSDYQAFLSGLSARWPVINAQGAMDGGGVWHSLYNDIFSFSDDVRDYRILQYNHLMDPAGLRADVFSLSP